jgi:hypothetical protein
MPVADETNSTLPRQRFGMAYYAALVSVLYVKGVEALIAPDGLTAAIWLKPLSLCCLVLLAALILAPVALLNVVVFVRPFAGMRAARACTCRRSSPSGW